MIINMQSLLMNFFYMFLKISGNRNFPEPLAADQEHEYFMKYKSGDSDARDTLIVHNLRLVAHIVKKYYSNNKNQDDLMSIGTVGLIKAIDSFDMSNGARFATYASKCLQNEILMYFRSQKKLACEVSINETIDVDKDGNPLTYIDIICCDDTIADDLDIKVNSAKAISIIRNTMSPREKQILIMRYGLDGKASLTQREIAAKLNISRSYVSRIEKAALEKIKEAL